MNNPDLVARLRCEFGFRISKFSDAAILRAHAEMVAGTGQLNPDEFPAWVEAYHNEILARGGK